MRDGRRKKLQIGSDGGGFMAGGGTREMIVMETSEKRNRGIGLQAGERFLRMTRIGEEEEDGDDHRHALRELTRLVGCWRWVLFQFSYYNNKVI
ncbi:hypothetical protein QQ045_033394 [Rhodiola kirilowii]